MLLVKRVNLSLVGTPDRSGARVAATRNENQIFCTAPAARDICTDAVQKLPRAEARVDLVLAANAPPAHGVVVAHATLHGAKSTLYVKKDARASLMLRIPLDAAAKPTAAAHFVVIVAARYSLYSDER